MWKVEKIPLIAHEFRYEVNRKYTNDRGYIFTETYPANFETEEAAEETVRRLNAEWEELNAKFHNFCEQNGESTEAQTKSMQKGELLLP